MIQHQAKLGTWMPKAKRNTSLARKFKGEPCVVCGKPGEGDHLKNFAGWSKRDVASNMWALCREHHVQKGMMGLTTFVKNHNLQSELEERGFEYDDNYGGWLKKF